MQFGGLSEVWFLLPPPPPPLKPPVGSDMCIDSLHSYSVGPLRLQTISFVWAEILSHIEAISDRFSFTKLYVRYLKNERQVYV